MDVLAYDKALVRGRVKDAVAVTVDGRAVELDIFGAFEAPLTVDPDKAFVDVIATDALGNPTRIKRSVKIASPMSAESRN